MPAAPLHWPDPALQAPLLAALAHGHACWPEEACGVIFGGSTPAYLPGENAAQRRQRAFTLSPALLIAEARRGRRPVAFAHSHPRGDAEMSAADHAGATLGAEPAWPGVDHIIIAVSPTGPAHLTVHRWHHGRRRYQPVWTFTPDAHGALKGRLRSADPE